MTTAVILVLVGSATHATWNLLASRTAGSDARLFVWVYSCFSLAVLAPACGVALLLGAAASWPLVWASLASGVFHIAYALGLQAAYARSDVNVTYPVARGLGPVLVALVAVIALGENLGWPGWIGIALITAGVATVSTGVTHDVAGRARRAAGLRWGLLVASSIAVYTLWDAHAVTDLDLDPVLYYTGTGVWMFLLLSAACWHRWSQARVILHRHWRVATLIGALTPISYVLVLIALTRAPVSVVAPLRGTSIVMGSVAAWWWLGESNGGRRLLGAVVVTAGIAALVIG